MKNTSLQEELIRYLDAVAGDRPWLEPAKPGARAQLPIFLREKYKFLRADLFGRKLSLAIHQTEPEPSPTEYARDAEALRQVFSEDVILVLSALPSYVRNRLIQRRVPFIVPGTQMFLPMLMIDLREQYPRRAGGSKARLSSVAQVVIIYHLIRASISDVPLGIIAQQLQYSAMSLSKAQEELQEAGICEVERSGKALFLRFEGSRPAIWLRAIPFLSTPVKKTQWIRFGSSQPHAFKAGLTALSADTMLADDSIPTLAMRNRDLLGALRQGELIGCASREESETRMESWAYDPGLLSRDGQTVDPCSLYLSLRHSADERIQKELEHLIEKALQ